MYGNSTPSVSLFSRLFGNGASRRAGRSSLDAAEALARVEALDRAKAVIEFTTAGTILHANENFLQALGWRLEEIQGQHHSIFVDPTDRASAEYREFWNRLGRGEHFVGEFRRVTRDGREIWIEASYNPLYDREGKPYKVVKYATDVTERKLLAADMAGQVEAIGKAQAVISFTLEGEILDANEAFLQTVGYSLDEVRGKHHRVFVAPEDAASPEYRAFWEKLGRGEFDAGRYRRRGKDGREIWLQATYNPIYDMNGRPFKVVKYASDVTEEVMAARMLERAVTDAQQVTQAAMHGDLTARIPLEGKDGPIASLCEGVNALMEKVSEVIVEVSSAADALTGAANQVSATAQSLSQAASEQAASVEETTASIDTMCASISQNNDNATVTDAMATKASQEATEGGEAVERTVQAMKQIAAKISIVDDIAYQTNLLALNAAIEAARAGEHGKGFAVVAAEVRKLAERSQEAAQEIGELAEDSVSTAERAGSLLAQIVPSIQKTSELVQEIAAASQEQNTSVGQIGDAMGQLSKATQQNASASEELAATSEELTGQAGQLQQSVAFFQVNRGAGGTATAGQTPQAPAFVERRAPDSPMRGQRSDSAAAGDAGADGAVVAGGNFRPF